MIIFEHVDRDGDRISISDDLDPSDGELAVLAKGRVVVYLNASAATAMVDAVQAHLGLRAP